MYFNIITLFPDFFETPLKTSIIKKAIEKKILNVNIKDLRKYTNYKHKQCDDKPYGGGCGMVLMIEPIYNAIKEIKKNFGNTYTVYLSPQGKVFNQSTAKRLSKKRNLTLICGHYEGIDNRIVEQYVDEEVSVGDYILTGGEPAALVLIDVMARLIPGVVQKSESIELDSLGKGLLKYPQYTKPDVFQNYRVPDILLSGNHQKRKQWQWEKQLDTTKTKRPDLYKKFIKRGEQSE